MTDQRRKDLKGLQTLDLRIGEAKQRILDFEPKLEEVEKPALTLESELGATRTRVQEMKLEERRLELSAEEKRTRRVKLEERLGSVRNLREEAAVSAELEMVKRAMQNDEQEALGLLDQLRKAEERAAELETSHKEASRLVEPQRQELLEQRDRAEKEFQSLKQERARFASSMDKAELKTYDAIRAGGRAIAVADLTEDGACGHCYGMVPLQLQNEIRHGSSLIRCESCGVILTAPGDEPETPLTPAQGAAAASAAAEVAESAVASDGGGDVDDMLEEGSAAVAANSDEGRAGD
jgi:predicted  nucleic acid-binding Zn-ribbon protein